MYTLQEIENYRCPRWEDWPDLDLYMDQVVSVLEKKVTIFYPDEQAKPVTAMMINNYVKQKIITPSKNKKYQREHLAYLYVIFLLKSVLNLTDIYNGITLLSQLHSIEKVYDIFCDEIEAALATAFSGKENRIGREELEGVQVIHAITLAFAYTQRAKFLFANQEKSEDLPTE